MWLVSESQHETIADSCLSRPGGGCHLVLCKPKMLCYTLAACEHLCRLFLGSSAVEHPTVNRMVAGSNPARGANGLIRDCFAFGFVLPPAYPIALAATITMLRSNTCQCVEAGH